MDSETSTMSFHVGYMCKYCELIFKSTYEFCTHKVEFHFSQLTKSRCIVFEELIVEPTETELTNFRKAAAVVQLQFKNKFENKLCLGEIQEPDDPVFMSGTVETETNTNSIYSPIGLLALTYGGSSKPGNSSDIKNEWMEETSIKYEPSQQNEELIGNSVTEVQENDYCNITGTESNFIDADIDVDLTEPQVNHLYHNSLAHFDATRSTESMSSSTFTAETERQNFDENQSDSVDDPLPSTTSEIPKPTEPTTAITTNVGLNNSVLSQLELKCQTCSKQFSSCALFGIHVGICKLYNSGKTIASTGPGPELALVPRSREEPDVQKDILLVKCQECYRLIKGSDLEKHMKNHQARAHDKARRAFVCQICGTAFGSQGNLDNHARVHSDETPNKCTFPGCHSAFKYRSGLSKHFKQHPG